MTMSDDGSCGVTIHDVMIDGDDAANVHVNSLNLSNWLKAVTVMAAAAAIPVLLLLSTHHSMLLI